MPELHTQPGCESSKAQRHDGVEVRIQGSPGVYATVTGRRAQATATCRCVATAGARLDGAARTFEARGCDDGKLQRDEEIAEVAPEGEGERLPKRDNSSVTRKPGAHRVWVDAHSAASARATRQW